MSTLRLVVASSIATLLAASSANGQTTWFVDVNAAPGGDGTAGSPYDSIQTAIASATTLSGDTLAIADGEYVEQLTIDGKALVLAAGPNVLLARAGGSSGPLIRIANVSAGPVELDGMRMAEFAARDSETAIELEESVALVVRNSEFLDHRYVLESSNAAGATISFENCTIVSCGVTGLVPDPHGAVLLDAADSLTVSDTLVRNSLGPVFNGPGSAQVLVTDSSFLNNRGDGGGGVNSAVCSIPGATFIRCEFIDNLTQDLFAAFGGALRDAIAEECLFVSNEANGCSGGDGGAMHGGSAVNCTFVRNELSDSGFFVGLQAISRPTGPVRNCIFFENEMNGPATFSLSTDGSLPPGNGNILNTDPRFVSTTPGAEDYSLRNDSPAIDAGDPVEFDPDGTRRDMGFRTFQPLEYCEALTSSLGTEPEISVSGIGGLTGPDDFTFSASGLIPNQFAIFAWSFGEAAQPFFGGTLCLGMPIVRTDVTPTGAGNASFFFSQAYMVSRSLVAYDALYGQWWFRDPGAAQGVGLTAGIAFAIFP